MTFEYFGYICIARVIGNCETPKWVRDRTWIPCKSCVLVRVFVFCLCLFIVIVTQAKFIWVEVTSIEKMSPSEPFGL